MMKICLLFICSIIGLPIYCSATYFTTESVENVNGGLRVNFTLASTIPGNTNYIVVAGCIISNTTTNGSSVQSVACGDYNFTQLEDCCNDCVTNTDGYLFAEGPVQAGKQYYCSLFGFFNGPNDNVDTGNVLASTGIPSQPGFNIAVESNRRALNVSVGSEYSGGDDIKYRIKIQDENSSVVHDRNYTTMYFEIEVLDNGEYTVTAWTINEYGTSESFQANVVVNVTIIATSSSTTVVSQTNDSDANIGPIVGGVVGGVVVLIVVAVAIIASVVALLVVKKNKTVNPVTPES